MADNTGIHPLRSLKSGVSLILAGVALAAVCFGAGFFTGGRSQEEPQLSSVTVEQQLQQISQLATTQYAYTNMGQFERGSDFYGIRIPFTTSRFIVSYSGVITATSRFIVSYSGVITAGVDLSQAQVEVTDEQVTVTLPAAQILSHEIDPDSLEVFDETRSIFNPITIEDYNGFQADQQGVMEEKALQAGLLIQAQDQAEAAVTGLLTPLLDEGITKQLGGQLVRQAVFCFYMAWMRP